ncbi:MAG: hypothetical protein RIC35_17605 [Marinoscillum sp.]
MHKPAYKLFNSKEEIDHKDLQDKAFWCRHGSRIEESFVAEYGTKLGAEINPEKNSNPYVPDLLIKEQYLADLKTQNTPFFSASERYGYDPTYTVVFNEKDRRRYSEKYPDIYILFWVDWMATRMEFPSGKSYRCEYLCGVWAVSFERLNTLCNTAPLHDYQQRKKDELGNAKASYLIDLRNLKKIAG